MASTQKCYGKGTCVPGPVPNGQIRIYSMRFCPFAQRTRLVLSAKGVKHETVNINLKDKPEWFLAKNPLGLVPTLETPFGQVIYESPITCEYLDEVYPEKKLFPSDPFEKAQQKMLLEEYSKVIPLFYKIPGSRKNGEDVSALEAEFKEKLSKLNEVLVKKKTSFFGGNSVTMIDYLIWPWFERLEAWQLNHCLDGFLELKKWVSCMLEDPAVKDIIHNTDTHKAFFNSYLDGNPNYDYGL
ncbi:glutathione S-transferase omega-1 isoform X1 [Electrophorus electricus]|uniref:Glutathione S-transferase omega n=1 Tax=Electrophorus electricus TaxID=8005 RepID=A0A4W4HPD6_ELEEL|nr:glutathione S-transferase omega-1 isoform X1 [Electrophorus electricus]XP_026873431.1 glutathione S-transferase omega-1 isoform X1 [Electrophorus electricus]XP_035387575.1 glutathione S-transferase omega-1 isoform X1 [Electrophorus electricus]